MRRAYHVEKPSRASKPCGTCLFKKWRFCFWGLLESRSPTYFSWAHPCVTSMTYAWQDRRHGLSEIVHVFGNCFDMTTEIMLLCRHQPQHQTSSEQDEGPQNLNTRPYLEVVIILVCVQFPLRIS